MRLLVVGRMLVTYTSNLSVEYTNGFDGESKGQSLPQRAGDGGNPALDALKLTPELTGRTDRNPNADDLRRDRNQ